MLKITHLNKTFFKASVNENLVLRDINLTVTHADFVTIIGSNGAGKTTLLNIISGVFPPEEGRIEIAGMDATNLPEHKRASFIGRVFQNPLQGTASSLTLEENLAIATLRGKKRGLSLAVTRKRREKFKERLNPLGLGL